MKYNADLTETDIIQIIADHFEVDPKQVTLSYEREQQDGPHYSPPSFSATVEDLRVTPKGAKP